MRLCYHLSICNVYLPNVLGKRITMHLYLNLLQTISDLSETGTQNFCACRQETPRSSSASSLTTSTVVYYDIIFPKHNCSVCVISSYASTHTHTHTNLHSALNTSFATILLSANPRLNTAERCGILFRFLYIITTAAVRT